MKIFIYFFPILFFITCAASNKKYDTVAAADSQGMREPQDHSNSPGLFITTNHDPVSHYRDIDLQDSRFPETAHKALTELNNLKPEHRVAVIAQAVYALPPKDTQAAAFACVRHAYLHEDTMNGQPNSKGELEMSRAVKKLDPKELAQAKQLQAILNAAVEQNGTSGEGRNSVEVANRPVDAPPKNCCIVS